MKLFLVVAAIFYGICGLGQPIPNYTGHAKLGFEYYSFADFQRDVVQANAMTVEDGIRILPKEFKQNFTFVKNGSALQSSTAEFPRAILFGETAHLVATFNGSSDQMGYDAIETVEFDESTQKIAYRSILFKHEPLGNNLTGSFEVFRKSEIAFENQNIIVTKPNPHICIGCHTNNSLELETFGEEKTMARYIWDRPRKWITAFGANDNREGQDFLAKKRQWIQHPRYRQLFENDGQASGVYPYHVGEDDRRYSLLPNERLADLLAQHYSQQMATALSENKDYLLRLNDEVQGQCGRATRARFLNHDMQSFGFQFDYPLLEMDLSHFDSKNRSGDENTIGNNIAIQSILMSSPSVAAAAYRSIHTGDMLSRGQVIKRVLSAEFEHEIVSQVCAKSSF